MKNPLLEWQEIKNMDKDLAEVYVAISQEVFLLHSRWCEYLTLYGTSKDHIEVMNKIAPNFFSIIQIGLQENITLQIARLIDPPCTGPNKKYKNLSIKWFPELIQNGELKEKVETLICLTDKVAEPCKTWRDQWHAHRDKDVVLAPEEARPLPRISQQNIREPIDAITKIRDVIASHYLNRLTSTISLPQRGGAENVLEILDKHIRTQQETLKAKRERVEKAKQSPSS